eukprot:g2444.t1
MRSGAWGQRAVQFASTIVDAAAAMTDIVSSTVADAGVDANVPIPHTQTASLALLPALELLCVTGCTECLKDLLTGEDCLGLLPSALRLVVSIGPIVGTGTCAGQVESEVAQVNGATCGAMADPVALRTLETSVALSTTLLQAACSSLHSWGRSALQRVNAHSELLPCAMQVAAKGLGVTLPELATSSSCPGAVQQSEIPPLAPQTASETRCQTEANLQVQAQMRMIHDALQKDWFELLLLLGCAARGIDHSSVALCSVRAAGSAIDVSVKNVAAAAAAAVAMATRLPEAGEVSLIGDEGEGESEGEGEGEGEDVDEREDVMSASVDEGDDEEYCNDGSRNDSEQGNTSAQEVKFTEQSGILVHHLICLARRLPGTFDVDTDERRLAGTQLCVLAEAVPLSLRDALLPAHRALRAPQERHVRRSASQVLQATAKRKNMQNALRKAYQRAQRGAANLYSVALRCCAAAPLLEIDNARESGHHTALDHFTKRTLAALGEPSVLGAAAIALADNVPKGCGASDQHSSSADSAAHSALAVLVTTTVGVLSRHFRAAAALRPNVTRASTARAARTAAKVASTVSATPGGTAMLASANFGGRLLPALFAVVERARVAADDEDESSDGDDNGGGDNATTCAWDADVSSDPESNQGGGGDLILECLRAAAQVAAADTESPNRDAWLRALVHELHNKILAGIVGSESDEDEVDEDDVEEADVHSAEEESDDEVYEDDDSEDEDAEDADVRVANAISAMDALRLLLVHGSDHSAESAELSASAGCRTHVLCAPLLQSLRSRLVATLEQKRQQEQSGLLFELDRFLIPQAEGLLVALRRSNGNDCRE